MEKTHIITASVIKQNNWKAVNLCTLRTVEDRKNATVLSEDTAYKRAIMLNDANKNSIYEFRVEKR